MLCAKGRGTLERGGESGSLGRVAQGESSQQRKQGEENEQTDKDDAQERQPVRLSGAVALDVGNEEREDGDRDCRDGNPKPHTFLAEGTHGMGEVYTRTQIRDERAGNGESNAHSAVPCIRVGAVPDTSWLCK